MDPNLVVLIVLVGVAIAFGLGAAVFLSERVREHGLLGAFRRAFSGGAGRNPYSS
jgi:ABC-type phosphate transport system permease subunit